MHRLLLMLCVAALSVAYADMMPELKIYDGGMFCQFENDTDCRYTYTAHLNGKTQLEQGDFLTIYDFAGYVNGSATAVPNIFTFSTQKSGVNPPIWDSGANLDNPNVENLTWTYNGANAWNSQETMTFSASSTYWAAQPGWYSTRLSQNDPANPTAWVQCIGNTWVPYAGGSDVGEVPEPMTMSLIGGGLAALGLLRRRRAAA